MTLTRRLAPAVPRIQWLAVGVMLAFLGCQFRKCSPISPPDTCGYAEASW